MQALEALIDLRETLMNWRADAVRHRVLTKPRILTDAARQFRGSARHQRACQVRLDRFSPPLYDTPAFTKQVSLTYIPDMPGSEASHGGDNDVEL